VCVCVSVCACVCVCVCVCMCRVTFDGEKKLVFNMFSLNSTIVRKIVASNSRV